MFSATFVSHGCAHSIRRDGLRTRIKCKELCKCRQSPPFFFRPTSLHFKPLLQVPLFLLTPASVTRVERSFHAATRSHQCRFCWPLAFQPSPRGGGGASQRNRRLQRLPAARSTDERVAKATQTARRRGAVFRVPSRSPPSPRRQRNRFQFLASIEPQLRGASAGTSEIVRRCTSLETGRLGIVSEELRDGSSMQRHRDAALMVAAV